MPCSIVAVIDREDTITAYAVVDLIFMLLYLLVLSEQIL